MPWIKLLPTILKMLVVCVREEVCCLEISFRVVLSNGWEGGMLHYFLYCYWNQLLMFARCSYTENERPLTVIFYACFYLFIFTKIFSPTPVSRQSRDLPAWRGSWSFAMLISLTHPDFLKILALYQLFIYLLTYLLTYLPTYPVEWTTGKTLRFP